MIYVALISWALLLSVVAYLITLVSFVYKIRREESDYWQSIGSPGLWEPNGQAAILKYVFLPNKMPERIALQYKVWLNVIRAFAFLGLTLFAAVLLMVYLGVFERH